MKNLLSFGFSLLLTVVTSVAQEPAKATSSPSPVAPTISALGVPKPGPTNDAPYAPQPILPGGVVVALYASDSPQLNQARVREAEQYNLSKAVPGRIS